MAETTINGPTGADPYSVSTPLRSKSYTGAGSGWAGGNDLAPDPYVRAVRCGTAGNLHVAYPDGATDTFDIQAGETVQGVFKRIYADSTAEDVTLFW